MFLLSRLKCHLFVNFYGGIGALGSIVVVITLFDRSTEMTTLPML